MIEVIKHHGLMLGLYKLSDGTYSISIDECWIDGNYDSRESAILGAELACIDGDLSLNSLCERVNRGESPRSLTEDDFK